MTGSVPKDAASVTPELGTTEPPLASQQARGLESTPDQILDFRLQRCHFALRQKRCLDLRQCRFLLLNRYRRGNRLWLGLGGRHQAPEFGNLAGGGNTGIQNERRRLTQV